MGRFAQNALMEARRFGQNAALSSARQFGRKITHVAQVRGDQVRDLTGKVAGHTDLLGLNGLSKGLRAIGNTGGEIANVGRLLDQNRPRAAVDRVLKMIGKDY